MSLEGYIHRLQSRCYQASNGELNGKEMEALADEAKGGFGRMPIVGASINEAALSKNWNALAGALGACLAIGDSGERVNVTQNANPQISQTQNLTMNISVSQVLEAMEADDLSEEDIRDIKALLLDAEISKGDESKLKAIGKKIADFAFDKATSSLPALLSFVTGLFQ